MKHVCTPRHEGIHVQAAVAYLKALGATAIAVLHSKRLRVSWRLEGRPFVISVAASSKAGIHAVDEARQKIHRVLRLAGLRIPAAAAA